MHIIFEHPHPLPVKKYGGIERILFWQMKYLVRSGHQVSLIGHPDSNLKEYGINVINQQNLNNNTHNKNTHAWVELLPDNADLIHLFYAPMHDLPLPYLSSLGCNGKPGEVYPLNSVFVSRSHAQNHKSSTYIYNALDLEEYPLKEANLSSKNSLDHFLFLAKASWKVKNVRDCIKLAKKTKKHLHIAGGRKFCFSPYVHSYGMVDQEEKRELLKKTHALLFPVRWPEPFGIALIEALSFGLPLFGSPYGSLSEIITEGVGKIFSSYEEMLQFFSNKEQLKRENFLSPFELRKIVEEKYSMEVMVTEYLKLYEKILRGEQLHSHHPTSTFINPAETLLPF